MNQPVPSKPPTSRSRAGRWILLAIAALLVSIPALYRIGYGDAIYPGVRVAGIDLGGLNAPAAVDRLREAGFDPDAAVSLGVDDMSWQLEPGESGLAFDINATATAAWQVGRGRGPSALIDMLAARLVGRDLRPIVRFDEAQAMRALAELADAFDREAVNAHVRLEGTLVQPAPAVTGRFLNMRAARDTLEAAARAGAWPIRDLPLDFSRVEPEVTDASEAIATAQSLLAQPLTLRAEGETWTLAPEMLAPMLTTTDVDGAVQLDLDRSRFKAWLEPITETISRTAALPRFRFDPEAGNLTLLESGVDGRRLNLEATAERVLEAGRLGSRLVRMALEIEPPAVADTVTAAELGIREVVGESTSRYAGSAPGRVHNVALATSKYDGLLIPPDAVFSFNEHLGDVSEEEGYEKTLIILDGATADGVGGGVCQVSTTLFRAAFWAGLPIVERHAHGYRVGYYEQGEPPGFDATIYSPIVDLKLRNDTGAWLLIDASTNQPARTARFILYGSRPDREVELAEVVRSKPVPPPAPRIEIDPELAPGTSEVVELARDGLSVSLTRVIREAGEERRDVFHSTYRPTGQLTAVGPSLEASSGSDLDTGSP